jgi:hypothetical protein
VAIRRFHVAPGSRGTGQAGAGTNVKVAVQLVRWSIVTSPSSQSRSSPLHPAKDQSAAGTAVSVTVLPFGKFTAHVPVIVPAVS